MGAVHKLRGARGLAGDGPLRWDGVTLEGYTDGRGATKQVLIGPADGAAHFVVRYFEIPPGSASTLDEHAHDHGVVIVRGRGTVLLGSTEHAIMSGDVVYVAPEERHQFRAAEEPLGFLCVVPPRPS